MKKNLKSLYIILFFVVIFVAKPPLSLLAQDDNKAANEKKEDAVDILPTGSLSLITSSQLKKKFEIEWFKGHDKDIDSVVDELVEVMLNSGIANLPDFSSALVVESKNSFEKGHKEESITYCEYAIKLSPNISRFYFELANMHFRNFNIVKGINTYIQAMKVRTRNFMDSMLYNANILLDLMAVIIIFILVFTTITVLKYIRLFSHDVSHIFPDSLKKSIVKLYIVTLLLLPLILNLGIFWQIIYFILLGFIYGTKKEKYMLYFITALIALLPVITTSVLEKYSFINTDEVNNIYQANQGTWYLEAERNIERMLNKYPSDPDLLLSLGLISKRRRDYNLAEKYYLKGLKIAPGSYELNLNLGNVYLAVNRMNKAESYYKTAVGIEPENGTAHYNLNTLYLKQTNLDDAAREFQEAMKLAPDIVDYYSEVMNTSSPNFNRLVIDEQVNKRSYNKRYKSYTLNTEAITSKILPLKIKAIHFEDIPLVAAVLLVVLALLNILNKSYAFTSTCQKCGGAVCYRCQRSIKDNKLCSQCYYIIVKREGVDPKSKILKMLEIKNYVARRHFLSKLLSFFIPGTGHLLKGLMVKGLTFFILSTTLLVNIIIPKGFISELYVTGANEPLFNFGSYVLLLLLALAYAAAIMDINRLE
jgi:tetratricopeptide (TPR) repeat protein